MSENLQNYTDEELYAILTKGGKKAEYAFGEVYKRHSPRVIAYCRRFLGDEQQAQDVFQETFIRFYKSINPKREMTNLPAFILRIARNLCVNAVRKEKPTTSFEDYMVGTNDNYVSGNNELLDLIHRALDELPEKYREMFILREYDGLAYSDIADVTKESVSTVKVRIYRAKQKIRETLMPYIKDLERFD